MAIHCPKCKAENSDTQSFCGDCGTQLIASEFQEVAYTKTLLTPVEDLTKGTLFANRYEIIEELGKGGMGKVYKALDNEIHEEVAIKLLKPEIAADEKIIERFRNELKIARKISHKNVCRTYHIGKEEGNPYITMEFVPGVDLKSLIKEKGKLPKEEALSIAKQVCAGLKEAHELGVVHRDLKPQNIMIDESGVAKIMDFGIARSIGAEGVTEAGMIIGTPDYISPEQAEGENADHRSDIYSLGVILYEMVTGSVPFRGDTALSVALKHKSQLPQDPKKLNTDVSENLSRLILICMEKARERRYQTAEELLNDLQNIEEGLPLGTKIKPRRVTFAQTLMRKKLLIPTLAVFLAMIAAVVFIVFRESGPDLDPNRIVVAIFDNQTGDPAHDAIGRMAADLITQGLDQTGLVDIAPSMAVGRIYASYEGEDPLGFLAQQTRAGTVVTGSYYLQGDSIQFHAQVTDAREGKLLKALDPVSGPIEDPTKPIESLREHLMTTLALFFDPEIKDWAGVMDMPSSYEAYKEFLEGQKLFDDREFEQAVNHLFRAAALDPEYVQPKIWAAWAYLNLRKLTKANALVNEVDKLRDRLVPYDRYTLDYLKADSRLDFDEAYRAAIKRFKLSDAPSDQYDVGEVAVIINRPQEAVDLISQLDPEAPGLRGWSGYWYLLTTAHHMLGNYKKELKEARRGRKQYPEDYIVLCCEVRALAALGKTRDVNDRLDEGLNFPSGPSGDPCSAMWTAARELRAHGYREESFQVVARAIKWLENRPNEERETLDHRWRLAQLLYRAERWEEARVLFEALYKEVPKSASVLGRLGTLAARRGDREEALRFSVLLENIDSSFEIHQRRGGIYTLWRAYIAAQIGEKELSVRLLQEARERGHLHGIHLVIDLGFHAQMDLEPLYDYPPYKEFMKPKG